MYSGIGSLAFLSLHESFVESLESARSWDNERTWRDQTETRQRVR